MRVLRLNDSVGGSRLSEQDAPVPVAAAGELLIRVHAAGVTPTELLWYPTSHTKSGEKRVGAVPAHEFSGVVAAAGKDVGCLEVGQEVFGMNDWFADGAMADYCITEFASVAPKPGNLSHAEAASIPIGALTAWQGLFDRANLQPGERVLVHGGAGAVGALAIQLARFRGARVITTAATRNRDFVMSLGAEQVVDYENSRFEEYVRDVDVVFDTVGGETLERSWSVLGPQGRMVTIAANGENATGERVKNAFFIVEPNQKQLTEIGGLLETGQLKPVVDTVIPLAEAPQAYTGQMKRRGCGKIIVTVAG